MSNNFTMIPNILFRSDTDIKTLFKEHNDYKLLMVLDYLHINTNRFGVSYFIIEDIITSYKYKPDNHKRKINEQVRNCILFLISKGIVECDEDITNVKSNEFIKCKYNYSTTDFAMMNYLYVEKILNYKEEKVDRLKLLCYYTYLNIRMYKRAKKDGDINAFGGRAEICYPSYKLITEEIKISSTIIKKYNDILVKLNLIRIGNLGLFYYATDKNKIQKESPNFYTLYNEIEEVYKHNLKEGMKVYRNSHEDMIFTASRKYKNNDRQIHGYISRIKQLESEGKASQEQIDKRDSYIASNNIKPKAATFDDVDDEEFEDDEVIDDMLVGF